MTTPGLRARTWLAGTLLVLVTGGAAAAGESLFEKGAALLKSLGGGDTAAALTSGEIESGLREALKVGTRRVVTRVGSVDGFNADPAIHIPLPENLRTVQSALDRVGLGGMLNDLELKLNRAAETAAPKARRIFVNAITQMSLADVRRIYDGPDDAATRYFQEKMTPELGRAMAPVVQDSLAEVGAIQSYDAAMGKYRALPFVPDIRADLGEYVVNRGMDGIFHYLAVEEAAIRRDPAARTTELLQKVFSR